MPLCRPSRIAGPFGACLSRNNARRAVSISPSGRLARVTNRCSEIGGEVASARSPLPAYSLVGLFLDRAGVEIAGQHGQRHVLCAPRIADAPAIVPHAGLDRIYNGTIWLMVEEGSPKAKLLPEIVELLQRAVGAGDDHAAQMRLAVDLEARQQRLLPYKAVSCTYADGL